MPTERPARSAERREAQSGWGLDRFPEFVPAVIRRDDDARVKRCDLGAGGGVGESGRVAIVVVDPFEEGVAGCGRDRRAVRRHHQPLVPTARRYSVTWTVPVTPRVDHLGIEDRGVERGVIGAQALGIAGEMGRHGADRCRRNGMRG